MKKKEFEEVKDKENIKISTLELSKSDMIADSKIRRLLSKNLLVISVLLAAVAVLHLIFISSGFYDLVNGRYVIPFILLSMIIVLYTNDYFFRKSLINVIVHRYIDRVVEGALSNIELDIKLSDDDKED